MNEKQKKNTAEAQQCGWFHGFMLNIVALYFHMILSPADVK